MVRFMDLFVTRTYVVLSAIDDSVTFSPALLRKIRRHTGKDLRVLTVAVAGTNDYAFIIAPKMEEVTDDVKLPTIQYDPRSKEYGYHCFNPSVNRMLYDLGLDAGATIRCRVTRKRVRGQWCYIIHGDSWDAL